MKKTNTSRGTHRDLCCAPLLHEGASYRKLIDSHVNLFIENCTERNDTSASAAVRAVATTTQFAAELLAYPSARKASRGFSEDHLEKLTHTPWGVCFNCMHKMQVRPVRRGIWFQSLPSRKPATQCAYFAHLLPVRRVRKPQYTIYLSPPTAGCDALLRSGHT